MALCLRCVFPISTLSIMKYYAVRIGRRPGVYQSWTEAEAQVRGFRNAQHRSFKSEQDAALWMGQGDGASAAEPPQAAQPPHLSSQPARRNAAAAAHQRTEPAFSPPARRHFSSSSSSASSSSASSFPPPLSPALPIRPRQSRPSAPSVYTLYCDGASRGNPGLSGCGGVIFLPSQRVLLHYKHFLPAATNNIAEYTALTLGLKAALSRGIRHLFVRLDSLLVCNQVRGDWGVSAEHLLPQREEAQSLLQRLEWWELQHVPRELNTVADGLSNDAIDERSDNVVVDFSNEADEEEEDEKRGSSVAAAAGGGWAARGKRGHGSSSFSLADDSEEDEDSSSSSSGQQAHRNKRTKFIRAPGGPRIVT